MKVVVRAAVIVAALVLAAPADAVCDLPPKEITPLRPVGAFFVGDSTMEYALPTLARLGIAANSRSCRGFPEAVDVIRTALGEHRLPPIVGIGVGAGWPYFTRDIEHLLKLIGPHRRLALITHRKRGGAASEDTRSLRLAAARHPRQVILIDWVRDSAGHTAWFYPDHLHVTRYGGVVYARFIAATLRHAMLVDRCFPNGAHELVSTPLVRVYRMSHGSTWACRFSSGERFALTESAAPFAAAGPYIAFARTAASETASLAIMRLPRAGRASHPTKINLGASAEVPRITALVLTESGHAAWIDERVTATGTEYEVAVGAPYERLTIAADVDPHSLELGRGIVIWTRAGKPRRARFD